MELEAGATIRNERKYELNPGWFVLWYNAPARTSKYARRTRAAARGRASRQPCDRGAYAILSVKVWNRQASPRHAYGHLVRVFLYNQRPHA